MCKRCSVVSGDEAGCAVSCPWFRGFACCIMHQSGSLPQEPRGTAVPAPRWAPGFSPHEGNMNNRGWRPDRSATAGNCPANVCLYVVPMSYIESR